MCRGRRIPTLKELFEKLGCSIGNRPCWSFGVSVLLIVALCPGLMYVRLRDNIRTGYTPTGAESIRADEVYAKYYNLSGGPFGLAIVIVEKNGGSLLNKTLFESVAWLHSFVYDNFTINHPDFGVFGIRNVCGFKCNMNDAFFAVKAQFDLQWSRMEEGRPPLKDVKLTWPIASIYGSQQPMFFNMAGVTVIGEDGGGVNAEHPFTNIDTIKYFMLWLTAGKGSGAAERAALIQWEKELYRRTSQPDFHPYISVYAYGDAIANDEVVKSGAGSVPYFVTGVCLMFGFVLATGTCSAVYYRDMNVAKVVTGVGAIVGPLCGVAVSLSLLSWLGNDINALMFSMTPFLVIGIGVDDAFLMMHAWYKFKLTEQQFVSADKALLAHPQCRVMTPRNKRLGLVFGEVGPSMSITSVTNALAFTVGAMVPIPQIRMFSLNTALAIVVDYLIQLFVFGPLIVLTDGASHADEQTNAWQKGERFELGDNDKCAEWNYVVDVRRLLKTVVSVYCRLLTSKLAKWIAVICLFAVYCFAGYGVTTMQVTFSPEKAVPVSSQLVTTVMPAIDAIFAFAHDMTVVVRRPPPVDARPAYAPFLRMVGELERLPLACGPDYTRLWLRDYVPYVKRLRAENVFAALFREKELPQIGNVSSSDDMEWTSDLTYAFLPDFGRDPRYKMWSDQRAYTFIQSDNGTIELTSMAFSMIYTGMKTWAKRAFVFNQTRAILKRYPEFDTYLWDYDGPLLDLILNVKSITVLAGFVTMGCMLVISYIFVPSLLNVVCATLTIGSMCFDLLGTLSWWDCNIDPIMMVNILMAVGFCVDYTAHITYHYYHQSDAVRSPAQRLQLTFEAVAWPMLQASLSSTFCIAPLLFYSSYIFTVFSKTVLILTIYGIFHGLFILPVALVSLPQRWLTSDDGNGEKVNYKLCRQNLNSGAVNERKYVSNGSGEAVPVVTLLLPKALKGNGKVESEPGVTVLAGLNGAENQH